jgi:protease secretion system outer membrane protein
MTKFLPLWCFKTFALSLSAFAFTAQAQSFEDAVRAARKADAQYTAAQAEILGKRVLANQAGAAYYPSANVALNQSSGSGGSRRSLSLTQPLLSYDLYLNLKQSDPLSSQADAQARQANTDMVLRVYTSMADIVRQRESIRAINVQINNLQEQLRRSVRMRELGQGTVTEVSDFEVRLAVAQANSVSLKNNLLAAQRGFSLLTGLRANVPTLTLTSTWQDKRSLDDITTYVRQNAPAVVNAQRNLELAEIAARRVTAQYMPQVVGQATRTYASGSETQSNSGVAIVLSAPLGANQYYDRQRAATEITRAEENLRYAQDSSSDEVTRLYEAVLSYQAEVTIRERALESARLAVDGNEKSYQGGVKTNIDVLTSYQNLADA